MRFAESPLSEKGGPSLQQTKGCGRQEARVVVGEGGGMGSVVANREGPLAGPSAETRKCPLLVSDVLLSHGLLRSTIGARGLNFRVRNGTGCASPAMVADQQGAFCCQGRPSRALGAAQRDVDRLEDRVRASV